MTGTGAEDSELGGVSRLTWVPHRIPTTGAAHSRKAQGRGAVGTRAGGLRHEPEPGVREQ
jgi:hypothetical protein